MPTQVFTVADLKSLMKQGAQLVDVLDPEDFQHSHLPGAINIPLKEVNGRNTAGLDKSRPVVVYCNDFA